MKREKNSGKPDGNNKEDKRSEKSKMKEKNSLSITPKTKMGFHGEDDERTLNPEE